MRVTVVIGPVFVTNDPMIEYHIRRLERHDWRLLRSVRLRALADAPDAFSTSLADDAARGDAEWEMRAGDPAVAQFVALSLDGAELGMAVGAPHTQSATTAGLFGMWVAPEARGRRIGRALVEAVVDWACHMGYSRIVLDVGDTNVPAIRLYDACGFEPTGVRSTLPPPRQHILEHERVLVLGPDPRAGGES